jgi:hypothetical protein
VEISCELVDLWVPANEGEFLSTCTIGEWCQIHAESWLVS